MQDRSQLVAGTVSRPSYTRLSRALRGILFAWAIFSRGAIGTPLEECPFAKVGKGVVAVYSIESWNAIWESCRAPELGDRLIRLLREEMIPSVLEETGAPEEVRELTSLGDKLAEGVDWGVLRDSRISLVVWTGSNGLPMLTVQLNPEPNRLDEAHDATGQLLSFPSGAYPETWTWRDGDEDSVLCLSSSVLDSGTTGVVRNATEDLVYLRKADGAVLITLGHRADEALSGPGLLANTAFTELWEKAPAPSGTTAFLDFTALAEMISKAPPVEELVEQATGDTPKMQSSLVLDETMEALFSDDREILEKLRAVEADMDALAPDTSETFEKISQMIDRGLGLLADQGVLLYSGGTVEDGVVTSTLWRPRKGSEGASLTAAPPLSERLLALLRPDAVEVSLVGLPDFNRVYETVLSFLEMAPDGGEALRAWEGLQESIGLDVAEDVLPALGREVGWLARQTPKGGSQGIQVAGNEFYLVLGVGDGEKAKALVGKLEEFLGEYDLAISATRVAGSSFTVVDAGLFGKAMWGIPDTPPVFVVCKGADAEFLESLLEDMREGTPGRIDKHRRWETLQSIWNPHPTAVSISNLSVSWKQMTDQLRGARMMFSMMGASNPVFLSAMGFALELLEGIPTPDCLLRVDWDEGEVRVSRSLLLFPAATSESESEGP